QRRGQLLDAVGGDLAAREVDHGQVLEASEVFKSGICDTSFIETNVRQSMPTFQVYQPLVLHFRPVQLKRIQFRKEGLQAEQTVLGEVHAWTEIPDPGQRLEQLQYLISRSGAVQVELN